MNNVMLALKSVLRGKRVLACLVYANEPTMFYQVVFVRNTKPFADRIGEYLANALDAREFETGCAVSGIACVLGVVDASKMKVLREKIRHSIGSEFAPELVERIGKFCGTRSYNFVFSGQPLSLEIGLMPGQATQIETVQRDLVSWGYDLSDWAGEIVL